MNKIIICDVAIDNLTLIESLCLIDSFMAAKMHGYVVTPNLDHFIKLQKDQEFKQIYENASLVLADGIPLLWAARFLGTPLKEKVSGSDLFPRLCGVAAQKGYKLFFLGGRQGAASKAAEVLKTDYPGLQIAGVYCPPYGFENYRDENEKIIHMIRQAKPDILFVGLGAPKQEKWIYKYKDQYQASMSMGIGVSFEFVAGLVKRAPVWMQKAGLEWFWRLMMEPKRLWKRYLIDDPIFFWLVLKQKLSRKKEDL